MRIYDFVLVLWQALFTTCSCLTSCIMNYMYIHFIMAQFEIHNLIQIELIVCETIITVMLLLVL